MISIIIPCYNCEKTIEDCLKSVYNAIEKVSEYEIILINDGSTDETLEILNGIKKKYEKVRVITQSNHGVSYTRNVGIRQSKGKYISFIDSDDTINEHFYEKMLKKYNQSDEIDLVICTADEVKEIWVTKFMDKDVLFNEILDFDAVVRGYTWNKLYKSDIIKSNSIEFSTDVKFWEDIEFNLNYAKYIRKAVVINEKLYNYDNSTTDVFGNADLKLTGMKIWDNLLLNEENPKYIEKIRIEKYSRMIWLAGQLLAERNPKATMLVEELKSNRDYIKDNKKNISKQKYLLYKLLLVKPQLAGILVKLKYENKDN